MARRRLAISAGVLEQPQLSQGRARINHGGGRRGSPNDLALEETHLGAFNADGRRGRVEISQRNAECASIAVSITVRVEPRRQRMALKKRDFQLGHNGEGRPIQRVEGDDGALKDIVLGAGEIAMVGVGDHGDQVQAGAAHDVAQLLVARGERVAG